MSRGVGAAGGGTGEIGAEVDFTAVDDIDEGAGADSPRSSRISCAISAARPKSSSATAARFSSSKISILIKSVAEMAAGGGDGAVAATMVDESPVEAVEASEATAIEEEAEEVGASGEGVTAVVGATFTAPVLPALAAFAALAASRRASTELRVAATGGSLGGAAGADEEEEEDPSCLDTLLS